MSTRPRYLVVCAAVLLLAGGVAWHGRLAWRRDTSAAAALNQYAATLRERQVAEHARRMSVDEKRRELSAQLASTAPPPSPPADAPVPAQPTWLDLLQTDAHLQSLFLAHQRSAVAIEFGPLLQRLKLTPEQTATFCDNVMRHRGDQTDLGTIMVARQLPEDDPVIEELRGRQQAEYDAAQRASLGGDGYAQFKTYEQEMGARLMVNSIAGEAILAGAPLTREQVNQLNALVVKATQDPATGFMSDTADWDRVDREAQRFLTPDQFKLIHTLESLGPLGYGWRFQDRLNNLITAGDRADQAAAARH